MAVFLSRSLPSRERLRVAAGIALTHSVAIAVVFAARFAALGKLGGHPSTELFRAITGLPRTLGVIVIQLTWFRPFGAPPPNPWPYVVGFAVILAFVAAAAALIWAWPGPNHRRDPQPPGPAAALAAAATAITWLLGVAAVQASTGFVSPWHLLMPGLAMGLLVGAAAQQLGQWLRSGRIASVLGLAIVGIWIGWEASRSPLFLRYTHWHDASTAVEEYLERLTDRIDASADGGVISVFNPRMWIPADPSHVSMGRVPGLHVRSLPAWAALRFPDRRIEFRHRDLGNPSQEPEQGKLVVRLVHGWPRRSMR
jgi:hypothetical protein